MVKITINCLERYTVRLYACYTKWSSLHWLFIFFYFFSNLQPCLVNLFVPYSQSDLPPISHSVERPRAEEIQTRDRQNQWQGHWPIDHHNSRLNCVNHFKQLYSTSTSGSRVLRCIPNRPVRTVLKTILHILLIQKVRNNTYIYKYRWNVGFLTALKSSTCVRHGQKLHFQY